MPTDLRLFFSVSGNSKESTILDKVDWLRGSLAA